MTACREWTQPDGDHFRGLCTNEFWPKAGTKGCDVCVNPVVDIRNGLCTCAPLEHSKVRTLAISVEIGPDPALWLAEEVRTAMVGDYEMRTTLESAFGDPVYNVETDSFEPRVSVPIQVCSMGAPVKMIEYGDFPPAMSSVTVGGRALGINTFAGQKSWNGIEITIALNGWRQIPTDPPTTPRYIVNPLVGALWRYVAGGPHPRCESTFRSALGQAFWFGGGSASAPGNWIVTVTGGG